MPQMSTTTSTPTGYTIAAMQAVINQLITDMQAGKSVIASDIAAMNSSVYNLWRSHGHTASDRTGIDTFGNVTTYGVTGTTVTTSTTAISPAMGAVTTPGGIASDQQINAADINVMIAMVNTMRVHSHTITDAQGATKPAVVISNTSAYNSENGGSITASYTLQNNGQALVNGGGIGGQWINMAPTDTATAASYDAMLTQTGGSVGIGGSPLATWLNMGTTRSWSITSPYPPSTSLSATSTLQIRNSSTLAVVATASITFTAETFDIPEAPSCFPAGSQVLREDGSWTPIEQIRAGDTVMGMGAPVIITSMDYPVLGRRKLMGFTDGSLEWSEEHGMWTRDKELSQWWWSYNSKLWTSEATSGHIGGLTDNSTMRTGDQAVEWAHITGWKANTVVEETHPGVTTRLYLPRTDGSPIIVNGYVVGAGINQAGYDYHTLMWDTTWPLMSVAQPLPTV